jgi:hypothetical protein
VAAWVAPTPTASAPWAAPAVRAFSAAQDAKRKQAKGRDPTRLPRQERIDQRAHLSLCRTHVLVATQRRGKPSKCGSSDTATGDGAGFEALVGSDAPTIYAKLMDQLATAGAPGESWESKPQHNPTPAPG